MCQEQSITREYDDTVVPFELVYWTRVISRRSSAEMISTNHAFVVTQIRTKRLMYKY